MARTRVLLSTPFTDSFGKVVSWFLGGIPFSRFDCVSYFVTSSFYYSFRSGFNRIGSRSAPILDMFFSGRSILSPPYILFCDDSFSF